MPKSGPICWPRVSQVGAHDLIIVSTAMSLGFSVASADKRHFDQIEGLEFEWIKTHD